LWLQGIILYVVPSTYSKLMPLLEGKWVYCGPALYKENQYDMGIYSPVTIARLRFSGLLPLINKLTIPLPKKTRKTNKKLIATTGVTNE